jgi:beta-lactamase regulating signal transducer with metallopeptidase domain
MVNIITPNSPATFNQRVAMSTLNSNDSVSPQSPNLQLPVSETPKKTKTNQSKTFIAILGLVAFIGLASLAVLISSRQRSSPGPVAPNAPESKPQAYIEKPKTCSLTFEIPVACNSICLQTSDCASINPA